MGLSNCDSKSEWEHGGAAASPHWVPRGWRGALAGSHSPARGAQCCSLCRLPVTVPRGAGSRPVRQIVLAASPSVRLRITEQLGPRRPASLPPDLGGALGERNEPGDGEQQHDQHDQRVEDQLQTARALEAHLAAAPAGVETSGDPTRTAENFAQDGNRAKRGGEGCLLWGVRRGGGRGPRRRLVARWGRAPSGRRRSSASTRSTLRCTSCPGSRAQQPWT